MIVRRPVPASAQVFLTLTLTRKSGCEQSAHLQEMY